MPTRNSTRSSGNCRLNPKCCYDSHDLECPNKFYPPLLSTPTDFCAEVLAKGLPIPQCALAKPKKLVIEREPPPLAKPYTSRHLKNYQRWCYIWRQTYNTLTSKRNAETRPPVMSSGENHRLKKEDKELFDRTLHTYHLDGFYVKNAVWADSIRPKPQGDSKEIKEVITKRYLRDFPEMKRQRTPNFVRNEVSLPPRKPPNKAAKPGTKKILAGFNWEEQWAKTKPVEKMKEILACDIGLYGKTDPTPDNLIFKPILSKDGPSETIYDKRFNKRGEMAVPQLVFSEDVDEQTTFLDTTATSTEEKKSSREYYNEARGPIFRIRSEFSEVVLRFSKAAAELPHFIKSPSASTTLEEYFYDDNQHFSITTKCKDMRFIVLKNEGTTTIRYQWFRHPPNRDAQLMLAYTTEYKSLKLSKALDMNESQENVLEKDTTSDAQLKVPKKDHLEFHFSQLPGVLLPGQTTEFPIIFRSKKPGYFHETLYLLTHPRLNTEDGRNYAVSLTGVCTDIELAEKGNEKHDIEGLKRYLNEKISEEESIDLMDSILDRSLSEVTSSSSCSLPYGRVTAESIFYAHNRHYYYYCGKSEKALELVRQLIEMLVPKTRVENLAQCHLSIQSLYNLVTSARNKEDLYWSYLRTSQAEDLLEDLFDCMFTISKQRQFCWPDTDRRKYVACYTNMVVTFDEILLGFDRLYNYYNAPVMKFIDENISKQLISEYYENEEMQVDILKEIVEETGEVIESNIEPPIPIPAELFEQAGAGDFASILNAILEEEGVEGEAFMSLDEEEMTLENNSQVDNDPTEQGVMLKKPKKKKSTVLTLEETMLKRVKDERRQVLTEARVKLFEDMLCDGIERMLSTVDCFNNMLDYRSSDSIVVIDDLC